jgi:hypothetical protein
VLARIEATEVLAQALPPRGHELVVPGASLRREAQPVAVRALDEARGAELIPRSG